MKLYVAYELIRGIHTGVASDVYDTSFDKLTPKTMGELKDVVKSRERAHEVVITFIQVLGEDE